MEKNIVDPSKEVDKQTKTNKKEINIKQKNYTDMELMEVLRSKYKEHNQYFKVIQECVEKITKSELKEINSCVAEIESLVSKPNDLVPKELEKLVIKIPVFMYKLNARLSEKGLRMEISNYLNTLEITERIMKINGGTEKERLRKAEYESMVSTFTTLINSRVYYNIKNNLDYSTKLYDGVKKALSAQIEEMKLAGRN